MGRVYLTKSIEERVWPKVDKRGPDDCWEWKGARSTGGYGFLLFDSRKSTRHQRKAHRVMYELVNGPIPKGMVVMHRCDNPPCVNPAHLVAASQIMNMKDAWDKGRFPKHRTPFGEHHWKARLTWKQVQEIRSRYKGRGQPSHETLAMEYGVTRPAISMILAGKRYPEARRP